MARGSDVVIIISYHSIHTSQYQYSTSGKTNFCATFMTLYILLYPFYILKRLLWLEPESPLSYMELFASKGDILKGTGDVNMLLMQWIKLCGVSSKALYNRWV